MKTKLNTYTIDNQNINVQTLYLDSYKSLNMFKTHITLNSFEHLCHLYESDIIGKYSWLYGTVILFNIQDLKIKSFEDRIIYDDSIRLKLYFEKYIKVKNKQLIFKDDYVKECFNILKEKGFLQVIHGKRNCLQVFNVSDDFGLMSEYGQNVDVKFNTHFYIMDMFDCGSIYDKIGNPIGLMMDNGKVINPPLYNREVMCFKQDHVFIDKVDLTDFKIKIGNQIFIHNQNCKFITRNDGIKSKMGGYDIIVADNKVVEISNHGKNVVPSSGFIIKLDTKVIMNTHNTTVEYLGLTDVDFAIEVGNSAVINNVVSTSFKSPFYKLSLFNKPYPPSFYPLDFEKDKAPRMLLGINKNLEIMIMWFEGSSKTEGKRKGISLLDANKIAKDNGMITGIHLDGGGSANILIHNESQLKVSDRDENNNPYERNVPMGIKSIDNTI